MGKKNILIFVLFFSLLSIISNVECAEYNAMGSAVITHNDLRSADKRALENALINGIAKYFESTGSSENMPEITSEFIKFINSYKITERFINDYKVYYNVIVDIDQVSENDLGHFIEKITNSAVYFIKSNNPELLKINQNIFKDINKIFNEFSFSTTHEMEFYNNLSETPDIDELIGQFELSKATYLFYITIDISCSSVFEQSECKIKSNTQIYSKNERFPTIQAPLTKEKNEREDFFKDLFLNNLKNTLGYVRVNLIKLPENIIVDKTYEIKVKNYKKFATVQKIFNYLKGKEIISSFKPKTFTQKLITFKIVSTFDLVNIQNKLSPLTSKYNFSTRVDNESLIIDFKSDFIE